MYGSTTGCMPLKFHADFKINSVQFGRDCFALVIDLLYLLNHNTEVQIKYFHISVSHKRYLNEFTRLNLIKTLSSEECRIKLAGRILTNYKLC